VDRAQREQAERELARASAGRVRQYSTYEFGRARDERCRSIILPEERARSLLPELRETLPSGCVAFIGTTQWLGDEQHEGAELVVGPGASQLDILRLARSDATNYDMDTEDLVRKLREYDHKYGIDVFHAETDTIEFTLLNTPDDLSGFAADLYEFCPDVVDQGVGSVAALEGSIEVLGQVYLWWD
jgi:hypothetical protein